MAQLPSHATAQFRRQGSANIVGGVCLSRLQQGATYLGPHRYTCSAEFRSVGAHHPAFTPAWPTPQTRPGEAWRIGRCRIITVTATRKHAGSPSTRVVTLGGQCARATTGAAPQAGTRMCMRTCKLSTTPPSRGQHSERPRSTRLVCMQAWSVDEQGGHRRYAMYASPSRTRVRRASTQRAGVCMRTRARRHAARSRPGQGMQARNAPEARWGHLT